MGSRSFIALLLPVLVACSPTGEPGNTGGAAGAGGGSGGGGATCPPNQNYNGATPAVSLKSDLLADVSADKPNGGIFRRACAASACHDEQRPEAGLFISPPLRDSMTQEPIMITTEQVARMLGMVDGVQRMSQTVPTMPIVDPGKPWNSFLMRKMDGCFTDIAGQCTPVGIAPPPCGTGMPSPGDPLLPPDERDTVRRWIFQGAQNN